MPKSRLIPLVAGIALCASMSVTASGGALFDFLFRPSSRPHPSAAPLMQPYADPSDEPAAGEQRRADIGGPGAAYCVRLCDGRYFPIQHQAGATAIEVCKSFCPAAKTKIFSGGGIDHAVARDGTSYSNLDNAFVYRTKLVADCTCNGKTPYGLARLDAKADPTLRSGDLVATRDGMVAYSGSRRQTAEFTPVENYSGLSQEMRRKVSALKIVSMKPAEADGRSQAASLPTTSSARGKAEVSPGDSMPNIWTSPAFP